MCLASGSPLDERPGGASLVSIVLVLDSGRVDDTVSCGYLCPEVIRFDPA